MLGIHPDKISYLIFKARMFGAREGGSGAESGFAGTDSRTVDLLGSIAGNTTRRELMESIRSLDEEEQVNLVALAWIGRGTYEASDWEEALSEARHAHNARTAEYLTGLPLLGDYLDEGLAALGESSEPFTNRI